MANRPIRELVNSKGLRPAAKGAVLRERRAGDRFPCRLTGVLVAGGREFPVECLDISTGGMRLSSLRPIALNEGEKVNVRVRVDQQTFEETFAVVRTSRLSNA